MVWWPWIAALAVISFISGVSTGWPLLEHVAYGLATLEILGFAMAQAGARGLTVSHTAEPIRLMAGDDLEESYSLTKSRLPAFRVDIERGRQEVARDDVSVSLSGGDARQITLRMRMPRRGRYEVGARQVSVRDPFGLFRLKQGLIQSTPVTVYPRPLEVPEALRIANSGAGSQHRWHLDSAEATLGDLRPYHTGDPPSRIHWRSTARTGTIMVTDPESLRSKATWLLVDIASLLDPEDTAPRIATFLVEKLWQSGHELGVMVAGEQLVIVPARRGREQIARILEPLATVRAGRESQIDRLVRAASRCENPGSFIVVSAASRPERALQRLHRICPAVTFVRAQAPAHDSSVESSP